METLDGDRVAARVRGVELSGIRVIFDMAAKMPDVIRLEAGEPDFKTPQHICEAAQKAMKEGRTRYTTSRGIPELRAAIASKAKKENNIDADPDEEIVVTAGGSCAVYLAINTVVEEGDEVLIPDPTWPHYEACVKLAGGRPLTYPLKEELGFSFDIDEIKKMITDRTKMIVVATPSNPTGGVIPLKDLKALADVAINHNILILSDEVYEKIVYDGEKHYSIASLSGMKDRCITVNSFSKTYAMTGWRLGYAIAPKDIATNMAKLNLFVNSCPSSVSQEAGLAALTGPQDDVVMMLNEYSKRRRVIVDGLSRIEGFTINPPKGAFYAFPKISKLNYSSWDLCMLLLKEGRVATVPGSAFGACGEGYIRISYANSVEKIKEAISRIEETLSKIRR
ncbi:MAG: pyridoxal phosphate-dependent aminotransferase [Nitrososphaerales archaeon]